MGDIMSAFPSDYLKEADLFGKPKVLTITKTTIEKVGDDNKPVVHFEEADQGLVLNKTNANMISDLHGRETDDWAGKVIELFPHTTEFQGRMVPCIRVREVSGEAEELDDEIPF